MASLYKAMQEGLINGEFVVIITDHADAGIVERSKGWGIPLIAIERSQFDSKQAFEQAQLDALEPYCVDGIVLAGYMRIVGAGLIARYEHKILNIHPALLPSFPGLHGHQQAIRCGCKSNRLYRSLCGCRYGYRSYHHAKYGSCISR